MLERERKFSVSGRFELPDIGERMRRRTLLSTYFDTTDYRLFEAGLTLRYRVVEGDGEGAWQLKLPSGGYRSEIEAQGDLGAVPSELRELIAVLARDRELRPVATLVTRRSGRLVRHGGAVVAEVVHDRVTVTADGPTRSPFSEVEIELRDPGTEDDLVQIGRELRRVGARPSDGRPKLARALALDVGHRRHPSKGADAAEQVTFALGAQLEELIRHDPGARLGLDPADVHDARVAVRRLRAIIRVGRPLLRTDFVDETRAELERVGNVLGAVRDLDVLIGHVRIGARALPTGEGREVEALVALLEAERATARDALLSLLSDPGYFAVLDRIEHAAQDRYPSGRGLSLQRVARREHRRLVAAVRKLGKNPSDAALHRVRIKTKHARYAAELVAQTHPKRVQSYLELTKSLQELLGRHQDAVVAEQRISEVGRQAKKASTALVAGRLAQLQVDRRKAARTAFPAAWHALAERGHKTW